MVSAAPLPDRLSRRAALERMCALALGAAVVGLAACAAPPAATSAASSAAPSPVTTAAPSSGQAAPSTSARAAPPTMGKVQSVRVGVVGSVAEAGIYVAREKGYFQREGISIDLVKFNSVTEAIPSLSTNQVDVAAGAIGAGFFNAVDRGVDIRIVCPQTEAQGDRTSLWFLVRKDVADSGAIRNFGDFKGRTVAIPSTGGTNEYLLDRSIESSKLTSNDVNAVALAFPDMLAAFQNKRIDASEETEPLATRAEEQGLAVKWKPAASFAPRFQVTYIIYASHLRTGVPALARGWMVAYLQGARFYDDALAGKADRDELFTILAKNTTVKDTTLMQRMNFAILPPNGDIREDDITAQEVWAQQRGYTRVQPSLNTMLDTSFVDAALSQLGRAA